MNKRFIGLSIMVVLLSIGAFVAAQVVSPTVVQRPLSNFGYSRGIGVGTEWPTVANSYKPPKDGELFIKVGADPTTTAPILGVYSEKLGTWVTSGAELVVAAGSATAPSIRFSSDSDTGFFYSPVAIRWSIGGVERGVFASTWFSVPNGTVSNPGLEFQSDADNGMYLVSADKIGLSAGGAAAVQLDKSVTAGDTRLLLYDVDNATLERVTVGATDSGGAGYKVLRIPN
ncbi:MAG: hypothetical protein ACFFFO_16985 [Candidatus Thorarchaeota archaeon]